MGTLGFVSPVKINAKFEPFQIVLSEDLANKNCSNLTYQISLLMSNIKKTNNPVMIIGKNSTLVRMC